MTSAAADIAPDVKPLALLMADDDHLQSVNTAPTAAPVNSADVSSRDRDVTSEVEEVTVKVRTCSSVMSLKYCLCCV